MSKQVKRGYVAADEIEFSSESMKLLKSAQEEIVLLLDRGYAIDKLVTFVGNHYMLSTRQRMALLRATTSTEMLRLRKSYELTSGYHGKVLHIDGLNQIITLEVALSHSTLLLCMDQAIRDLAGLRGTYQLIDKTDIAIDLIGKRLEKMDIKEAIFYLDAPVSNTGRLKQRIEELLSKYHYQVKTQLVNNPDVLLSKEENVVTSDAIILNQCKSWINITKEIISNSIQDAIYLDFTLLKLEHNGK